MAKETVTLLKANPEPNPKRRRRRRRNPDLVSKITSPLPDFTEAASAVLGAGVVMQVPNMLGATRWMNVLFSLGATVAGAFALGAVKAGNKVVSGYALGGSIITAAKALHVGSGGRFGLDPGTSFAPSQGVSHYMLPPPGTAEAPYMNELPEPQNTGVTRPVGAFRESEFSYGGEPQDPLLS